MTYKVRLDIFEGPFDLLVYLIERSGLSIYDVNISEITTQYIEHVEKLQEIDPEMAAEFMVLAATLIRIKSKMLLPRPAESAPQDPAEDPGIELARRIEEYRKIKKLAEKLREKEISGSHYYVKPAEDISAYTDAPVEKLDLDPDSFLASFRAFLERKKRIEDVRKRYESIDRERMTMEKKSVSMKNAISRSGRLDFTDLIGDPSDLYDIVLTFVTMLEMVREGMIKADQDRTFGNITLIHCEAGQGQETDMP